MEMRIWGRVLWMGANKLVRGGEGPGLGGGAEDRGMPDLVHESGMFVLTD